MSRISPSAQSLSGSPSAFATLDRVAARTPDGASLFDNLSLVLGRERTGVVGRNGVGKTTLLRLIEGRNEPAAGAIARTGSIGVLPQTVDLASGEVVADILGVAAALAAQVRLLAGEGSPDDLAAADWSLEDRLTTALAEVGLAGLPLTRSAASLSGGEQTRLRLARLLFEAPDLILLDEPTNNLDADARTVIAGVLGRWKGGAVVVSHDRTLLRGMDRIVELSSLGAAVYGGGYDLYAARKAEEQAAAERDLAVARREAARVAREVQKAGEKKARRDRAGRRFAASGSAPKIVLGAMAERAENTSARAGRLAARQSAQVETALATAGQRVQQERALDVPMPPTGLPAGKTAVELEAAGWRTPEGRRVVGPLSLRLVGPERVAVTGPNGAGKTTLLRLIAGQLEPTEGRVRRPLAAAMLDQGAAILRPDETLIEACRRLDPGSTAHEAHAALARFLFRNTAALRTVDTLSGGEKLRAALACVLGGREPPGLLILDEPTNHLDLDSIAAIEAALRGYDGALIVVSHDRDFLDAVGIERELALTAAD